MQHVVERHGVGEFRFEDCTLTADPARVRELCERITARRLPIVWNCDVRADTASDQLFAAMRAAGCRRVFLGVESGSEKILGAEGADKAIRLDQVRATVRLAKKHGLRINSSFVLGLPGETRETALESFRFALELDPDYAMFSVLAPVVGSKLFARAVKEGKIDVARYRGAHYLSAYAHSVDIVEMSELKADELVELMRRFNAGSMPGPATCSSASSGPGPWPSSDACSGEPCISSRGGVLRRPRGRAGPDESPPRQPSARLVRSQSAQERGAWPCRRWASCPWRPS